MNEFLLRKITFRNLDKEEQDIALMQKERIKTEVKVIQVLMLIALLPLICILTVTILSEKRWYDILFGIIFLIGYSMFLLSLFRKFKEIIITFKGLLIAKIFFEKYTLKGNAILPEDFQTIEKEDSRIYDLIRYLECAGWCYSICFCILKALKKGKIKFIAIKVINGNTEGIKNPFTMHVLYVNNGWCFDTYSHKQYPMEKILKIYKAIEYKEFSYDDIKDISYDEFKEINYPELKDWCEKNDCHQCWKDEEEE